MSFYLVARVHTSFSRRFLFYLLLILLPMYSKELLFLSCDIPVHLDNITVFLLSLPHFPHFVNFLCHDPIAKSWRLSTPFAHPYEWGIKQSWPWRKGCSSINQFSWTCRNSEVYDMVQLEAISMGPCALELEAVSILVGSESNSALSHRYNHKSTNKIFHRDILKENFATLKGKQSHFPMAIVPGQTTGQCHGKKERKKTTKYTTCSLKMHHVSLPSIRAAWSSFCSMAFANQTILVYHDWERPCAARSRATAVAPHLWK